LGIRAVIGRSATTPGVAAALLLGAACAEHGTAPNTGGVVEIAEMAHLPQAAVACGTNYPTEVYFTFHMVNTSADTVAVQRVSTVGIVAVASREEDIGARVNSFESLEVTPSVNVLRPYDGDRRFYATLPISCTGATVRGIVDVYTIVTVTTSAGQFNARPVMLRIGYPGGGGGIGTVGGG
jgi:hypothetical protein